MAQENFQKVAYIALRNTDGSIMINVPLYVKVSELNKNGMTDEQEKIIERITETMMKRYEKQISAYFTGLKENKKNQFGGIYE